MGTTRRIVAALAAVVLATPAAMADVIISNLPGNDGTSTFMNAPPGGSNGGGVHDSKAAGFTMPAGLGYTLDFVTLRLEYFSTASVPVVQLYSNVGGQLGVPLHTLSNPAIVVGTDNFTFTPTSQVDLNANETYWLLVWNNASVANSFRWLASAPALAPTGLATSAGYRFSNGPPPPTGNSTTQNTYSINATIVPSPGAWVVVGLAGAGLVRRRR